jgi:hypothetical protein
MMLSVAQVPSLLSCLSRVTDPRQKRGIRHPFTSILGLTLAGFVSRIVGFAPLQRWAKAHWHWLRTPLGFRRQKPPHATTISRALAQFSVAELNTAFLDWVQAILAQDEDRLMLVAAVDGKTSKQALNDKGDPLQMLNVFAQDVRICLGQWALNGDKKTEPEVLKAHLHELFERYPTLRLLTGDALYSQRNLAEMIVAAEHDYLFQLHNNQPDTLEAAKTCFASACDEQADAHTCEKKVAASRIVFYGSTWTTPSGCANGWLIPVAECWPESIESSAAKAKSSPAKRGITSRASRRNA